MIIIGYILCIFGLIYVAAGLYELLAPHVLGFEHAGLGTTVPDTILALATLVEALTNAPQWLAACVVGVLLIVVGSWLVRRGWAQKVERWSRYRE
jgi:hypothetical protein